MARIETALQQRFLVRDTTTPEKLGKLLGSHFENHDIYPTAAYIAENRPDIAADYFRLYGLFGIVCAQFGHTQTFGHAIISAQRGYGDPGTPRQLLAIASYFGSVNTQAYPIKREHRDRVIADGSDAADGIWGIPLDVHQGVVKKPRKPPLNILREQAHGRLRVSRLPLCLPDPELNQKLADVGLDRGAVKDMPASIFRADYLLKAREATAWLLDDVDALMSADV